MDLQILELAVRYAPPWVIDALLVIGALYTALFTISKTIHNVVIPALEKAVVLTMTNKDDEVLIEIKKADAKVLQFFKWVDERIKPQLLGRKPIPNIEVVLLPVLMLALLVTGCGGGTTVLRQGLSVSSVAVLEASKTYAPVMAAARVRAEQAATLAEFDAIVDQPLRIADALDAARTALLLAELSVDTYEHAADEDYCHVISDVITAVQRVIEVLRLVDLGEHLPAQLENGLGFLRVFVVNQCDRMVANG